jgi:hypothetical protein
MSLHIAIQDLRTYSTAWHTHVINCQGATSIMEADVDFELPQAWHAQIHISVEYKSFSLYT